MALLVYQTLLLEFGEDAVHTVFSDSSFTVNGTEATPVELFVTLVEEPPCTLPLDTLFAIYLRTEAFLVTQGYPLAKFIDKLRTLQVESYMITSAHEILASIQPIIHHAYQQKNLYLLMFDFLTLVHPQQISDTTFALIGHTLENDKGVGCIEQLYDLENPRRYCYDPVAWKVFIIESSPMVIGLPAFDRVQLAAEVRTIEDILGDIPHEIVDGKLVIEGDVYGEEKLFENYRKENPLFEKAYSPEGYSGIVVNKEYYSENQKRTLLWKGCFYGAPTTLFVCHYTYQQTRSEKLLKGLIAQINDPKVINRQVDHLFLAKHKAFLATLEQRVTVHYSPTHQKVSIDGSYFTRNFPAQLLYFLCYHYLESGKRNYLYQDLISSSMFSIDPQKPNLNVRISRLQKKISEVCPTFHIEHTERGAFSFWSDVPLELEVVE